MMLKRTVDDVEPGAATHLGPLSRGASVSPQSSAAPSGDLLPAGLASTTDRGQVGEAVRTPGRRTARCPKPGLLADSPENPLRLMMG